MFSESCHIALSNYFPSRFTRKLSTRSVSQDSLRNRGSELAVTCSNVLINRYLVGGALAGMTATAIVYPLDLVRTIFAFQTERVSQYNGIFQTWRSLVAIGGVRSLYSGLGMTCMVTNSRNRVTSNIIGNRSLCKSQADNLPTFEELVLHEQ